MSRYPVLILVSLLLSTAKVHAQSDTGYVHLFDINDPVFPEGTDARRIQWAKEFIKSARNTEKTAGNYIKFMVNYLGPFENEMNIYDYVWTYYGFTGRYQYENFMNTEYELWADKETTRRGFLFYNISRSNENILRLWGIFDGVVLNIVKPCLAENRKERRCLEILKENYNHIYAKKGNIKKLSKLYDLLSNDSWEDYDDISKLVYQLSTENTHPDVLEKQGFTYSYDAEWFVTFWARRHHDGCAEAVYAVIEDMLEVK